MPTIAQGDTAAVRVAVEQANSAAVWGEALRSGDPATLATVWAGDALEYFSREVVMYRERGLRLLSTPLAFDVVAIELTAPGRAVAETREEWHDRLCTPVGELRGERHALTWDRYELYWRDNAWWVSGVDVELVAGSFDWTPAEDLDDGPSPCAAVLD